MPTEFGESSISAAAAAAAATNNSDAGNFECNICFDLAQDPIVTLCGHLFCWPCLYKWLHVHAHSPECPVCKALVEEDKLVPLYGRGKAPTDPRSRSVPSRPAGQRPPTAPPHAFPHAAAPNPWLVPQPVGGTRFGNYTFSAAIGGLGGIFPMLNFQVHGFPDAAAYAPAAGFPYGYANLWQHGHGHGHGHGHAHAHHGFQQHMHHGQQMEFYLKALLLLIGALVIVSLIWF